MDEAKWHPAASIFPMLEDAKLEELAHDIQQNGQREPILMLDGMVLDGRNRMRACELKGITPKTMVVKNIADPVAYVLSLNLHRRHLTASQAAMCAARARELYEQQAKERQRAAGGDHSRKAVPENLPEPTDARDAAGKAFGVSGKSVDFATKVISEGSPELVKAVDEGKIAVSRAASLTSQPKEEQKAAVAAVSEKKRPAKKKPNNQKPVATPDSDREKTERFAMNYADCAITQLRAIPIKNKFRIDAFNRVVSWIKSQTEKGN